MGWLSLYYSLKANDGVKYHDEYIEYLEKRIIDLQQQINQLIKWANYVDSKIQNKE